MNATQRDLFEINGYLRLPGFHPKTRLAGIRRAVLDEVKQSSERPGASKALRRLPIFQQIGQLSSLVKVRDLHTTLMTPELVDVIRQLAEPSPFTIQDTQLLLSPPNQGPWALAGLNWHVDVAADRHDRLPGVQAFFLIDDVVPHGGATLAIAGSHRLIHSGPGSYAELREALRSRVDPEPRLQALGVELLEMSGQAGDVFLMDMRLLHTPSVNAARNVRMMATSRCLVGI